MLPRLLLIAQVMTVWMMVDALRRKAGGQWYAIILLPFGEWFYFFSVKIHDPSMARVKRLFRKKDRPPTLRELRHRAQETPSFGNRLALAQGLHDDGLEGEAATLFGALVEERPDDAAALYGCGVCRSAIGDLPGALEVLTILVEHNRAYADYAGWLELADVTWETGARDRALEHMAALVKDSPRAQHRVTQAHYLNKSGQPMEAARILRATIEAHAHAAKFIRKRDAQWIRQAEQMLATLG